MDILRLMISCLTGIGALALGSVVAFVVWLLTVLHQEKHTKPGETGPLAVNWEKILEDAQK